MESKRGRNELVVIIIKQVSKPRSFSWTGPLSFYRIKFTPFVHSIRHVCFAGTLAFIKLDYPQKLMYTRIYLFELRNEIDVVSFLKRITLGIGEKHRLISEAMNASVASIFLNFLYVGMEYLVQLKRLD